MHLNLNKTLLPGSKSILSSTLFLIDRNCLLNNQSPKISTWFKNRLSHQVMIVRKIGKVKLQLRGKTSPKS